MWDQGLEYQVQEQYGLDYHRGDGKPENTGTGLCGIVPGPVDTVLSP